VGWSGVGAFRCHPDDPSFHDSGPARNCCFVFPRTAVEIQHEHERAFVANPNVVTFYDQGQAYRRNAVSLDGDRCDWFGIEDGHLIKTFTCRIPGDTFGFDSVTMGDVDKDGTADFLITSGWSGVHGFHSGRVFIISSGVKAN
jgi:hypothetical protein